MCYLAINPLLTCEPHNTGAVDPGERSKQARRLELRGQVEQPGCEHREHARRKCVLRSSLDRELPGVPWPAPGRVNAELSQDLHTGPTTIQRVRAQIGVKSILIVGSRPPSEKLRSLQQRDTAAQACRISSGG